MTTETKILKLAREVQADVVRRYREAGFDGYASRASRYRFDISKRMTACAGRCRYSRRTITLSLPIFSREENFEKCHETIRHELAHAAVGPRVQAHGRAWREADLLAGGRGTRCHNYNTLGLGRKTVRAKCTRCGHEIFVTKQMAKSIDRRGSDYRHRGGQRRCGGAIVVLKIERPKLAVAAETKTVEIEKRQPSFRAEADRRFND